MSIAIVIIFLLVIGVALYLLGPRIDPTIRTIIIVLLVVLVVLWLFDAFGIYTLPSAFHMKGGK